MPHHRSPVRRHRTWLVASSCLLVLAVVATACGGSSSGGDGGMMGGGMGGGMMGGGEERSAPTIPGARSVSVTARSFSFEPPGIEADAGEDLTISVTVDDVFHDFVIDELDFSIGADPGDTASGSLSALTAGRYTYYCSVPGHRAAGMEGTLVVGPGA